MRIVHLVESFSSLTETFIYDQVMEGQRQGLESWVLTLNRENAAERPFNNVHEIVLPSRWSVERIWSRLSVQSGKIDADLQYHGMMRRRIKQFLTSVKPDAIHAHFGPIGYLVMPVAQALKIPLAVSFYGYDVSRLGQNEMWRRRYEQMLRSADALLALSDLMREQLLELGAPHTNTRVVRMGKRPSEHAFREPRSLVQHWISVGRLVEKKGHLDCIRAFEIATCGTEGTLTIVGDGELRHLLMDEVKRRGLSQRVLLAGALPYREVLEKMREADAFILCSKTTTGGDTEGTPVVLVGAQAVGLPCVATRHSGIPEVIPAENHGFLAEEGNVPDIVERIKMLGRASLEELVRISRAGRRKIEREYDLEKEVAKLVEIYSRIGACGR